MHANITQTTRAAANVVFFCYFCRVTCKNPAPRKHYANDTRRRTAANVPVRLYDDTTSQDVAMRRSSLPYSKTIMQTLRKRHAPPHRRKRARALVRRHDLPGRCDASLFTAILKNYHANITQTTRAAAPPQTCPCACTTTRPPRTLRCAALLHHTRAAPARARPPAPAATRT